MDEDERVLLIATQIEALRMEIRAMTMSGMMLEEKTYTIPDIVQQWDHADEAARGLTEFMANNE